MPNHITITMLKEQLLQPGVIAKEPFTGSFKAFMKQDWADDQDANELIKLWEAIAERASAEEQSANAEEKSERVVYQKRLLQLTQKILQKKSEALTHENLECFSIHLAKLAEDQLAELKKEAAFKHSLLLHDTVDFELLKAVQKKIQKFKSKETQTSIEQKTENSSLKKYAPYLAVFFIGCVGVFKGIADGFNGVNALLSLAGLSGTPIALVVYAAFILTGIAVYVTFDYNRICGALGVSLLKVSGAIKKIYDECQLLEKMCDEIETVTISIVTGAKDKKSVDMNVVKELTAYKAIIDAHIDQLAEKRRKLEENQPSYAVRMAGKVIMGILGASLFFSGGFFGGYSLAVGLFALAVGSGPAIAVGLVVAIAGLISYLFLEGSEAFRVVDGLAGTSEKLLHRITETSSGLTKTKKSLQIHMEHINDLDLSFKGSSNNAALQHTSNIYYQSPNISPNPTLTPSEKIPDLSLPLAPHVPNFG